MSIGRSIFEQNWFQQHAAESCCSRQHAAVRHMASQLILQQEHVSEQGVRVGLLAKRFLFNF